MSQANRANAELKVPKITARSQQIFHTLMCVLRLRTRNFLVIEKFQRTLDAFSKIVRQLKRK